MVKSQQLQIKEQVINNYSYFFNIGITRAMKAIKKEGLIEEDEQRLF